MDITKELSSTAYLMGEFMSANDITIEKLAEKREYPSALSGGFPMMNPHSRRRLRRP